MKTSPPSIAPSVISGLRRWVLPGLSALLLAACGGGGSSSGSTGDTSGTAAVVESAPAEVTGVTATASDSAVVLSFTVSNPQNVTAFEAVCSGNGSSVTTRSASNGTATDSVTVTGLTNASSYSCTVSAINSSGASSASSPVQATAGAASSTPGAPGVLSMEGASTSAVLTFSESTVSGGTAVSTYVGICVGSDKTSYSFAAASPITVLGLTPELPYTCWVSGLNAQGSGKASAASVVTPKAATSVAADAPAAPTGVSVTRGAGSATVAFTTGTAAAASASKRRAQGVATDSGTLYRATCSKGDNVVSVESTSSPITVPQLTNGSGYSCSVTATTTAGTSADSSALSVTPSTVPDAPVLTVLNTGDTTATLGFTAPASDGGAAITRYHASCSSGTQTAAADASSAGTVTVAGLVNGSTYSCSVAAVNVAGTGAASNAKDATPVASTTPVGSVASAPQTVQAATGNGNAVISFAAVTDSASPVLDYTATCTTGSQQVSATGGSSPITVSGLTNGSTYSCSVTARTEAGNSPASDAQSVTPAVTAPAAPTLVSVTPGNAAISVAFTAGSDGGSAVTAFTATCGDKTGSGSASPVTVGGLTNGQIYTCSVIATNAVGTSMESSKASTRPRTVPQAPTRITATAGNGLITMGYTAPTDNGGADIIGYTAACQNGSQIYAATSSASTDTSITVLGMENDKSYDCSVTARNTAGASEPSASASATPAATSVETAPDAATNLQMTIGDKTLTVTFERPASNGADVAYTLVCWRTGDTDQQDAVNMTIAQGAVSATAAGLTNGKSYSCLIRTTRGSRSTDSGVVSNVPNMLPTAPTLGVVVASDKQLKIFFTKPAGNLSDVTYGASCSAGSVASSDGFFVITGLTNGQTYNCTVTATNSKGDASSSTSGTPATTPDAPGLEITAGTASASSASLTITVTKPTNTGGSAVTGYTLTCSGGLSFTPTTTTLSKTFTGLPNATEYTCSVTATNSAGSGASSSAKATTAASAPGVPTLVMTPGTAIDGSASMMFTVTAPSSGGSTITGYTVTCTPSVSVSITPSNLSTTVSSLLNNTSYSCNAKATNSISTGSASGNTAATTPPAKPTLSVTPGDGQLTYTITRASGVKYSASCVNNYDSEISGTSFTVSNLTNGQASSCTLKATNDGGSASSEEVTGTPRTVPSALTQSKIVITQSTTCVSSKLQATISYEAPASNGGSAITGYDLSWSVNGSTGTASNDATATSFTVLLPTGQGYTFSATIQAKNAAGKSAGTTKTATTVFCNPPTNPV